MSAKIFLNSSTKYIPQMDMQIKYSDNQGVEGTQTFLARKADVGVGSNLNLFTRGTRWEQLYPEIPILYRNLTMKTFDPEDHSPGIVAIKATFTGYQYQPGSGSSGEEVSVPTTALRPSLQEGSVTESKAWRDLGDPEKARLSHILNQVSSVVFHR